MPFLDQNQLDVTSPMNQLLPEEGPRSIPLLLDFTVAATWDLDAELLQARGFFSMIQSIFIDASMSGVNVSVTVNGTGQVITAKFRTQGYYSLLVPNPVRLTFSSVGGVAGVRIQLLNVPIPGAVWSTI